MSTGSPDGVRRVAVVVADAAASGAAPPGVDGRRFALAMAEDVIELVGELSIVEVAVLAVPRGDPSWSADVAALCWPGTVVRECRGDDERAVVRSAFDVAQAIGCDAAAVVAGDAPDLPGLLLGKVFRALGSAAVAVCASDAGAVVAAATRVPPDGWVTDELSLADADVLAALRSRAPAQAAVATGPSWHRLLRPGDVRRLDPGLEGWSATRALLSAPMHHDAPATPSRAE